MNPRVVRIMTQCPASPLPAPALRASAAAGAAPFRPARTPAAPALVAREPTSHLAAALGQAESLCIKCGFCLPACPTYRETGIEAASPRGRLDLMYSAARGRVSLTAIEPQLALCLGCLACETACPSGIRYHDMLEAERSDIAALHRGKGVTLGRRIGWLLLDWLVPSPRLLRAVVWGLWAYQRSGAQALLRATHLLDWLAPPLGRLERRMPPLRRPVRWRRTLHELTVPERGRATLLAGCIMDAAFGEVHAATAYVLRANGIAVAEAPGQTCCGSLHLHAGEMERARRLARRNIAAFDAAGDAPVVVNSAGCGAAMKEYGRLLAGDPEWAERAQRFAARVRDVSEYLAGLSLAPPSIAITCAVAYDDPCHLVHAQKIRDEPRKLLSRIPGLRVVPLREAEMCCGSAGSYSIQQPEMAMRLLDRKLAHIGASGADVVATGNPGCLLQLRLGMSRRGLRMRVVHPIELLAESYGLSTSRV